MVFKPFHAKLIQVFLLLLLLFCLKDSFSAEKDYLLKKIPAGYSWQEQSGKVIMEISDKMQAVTDWGGLLIFSYDTDKGECKRYIYDKASGRLIKLYVSRKKMKMLFSPAGNYAVLCTQPAGRIYFIDNNGRQLNEAELGDIIDSQVNLFEESVTALVRKPGQKKTELMIFDKNGRLLFEIYNAGVNDTIQATRTGSVITLSGYNIWNKVFSVALGLELAQGFVTKVSADERYLASLVWGADDAYNSEEYAQLLGITGDKLSEAKMDTDGVAGLFVKLYFLEIYSLENGELYGRIKLDGNYLKVGNTGNPAIKEIIFSDDCETVSLKGEYKGIAIGQTIKVEHAKSALDMVNNWIRSKEGPAAEDILTRRKAKKLYDGIENTTAQINKTRAVKRDRARAKRLFKRANHLSGKKLAEIVQELKGIGRNYEMLVR